MSLMVLVPLVDNQHLAHLLTVLAALIPLAMGLVHLLTVLVLVLMVTLAVKPLARSIDVAEQNSLLVLRNQHLVHLLTALLAHFLLVMTVVFLLDLFYIAELPPEHLKLRPVAVRLGCL
jgi:hypothetical protein